MKHLKFLHLHIRDFKSFLGEHQLALDLPLGVWFIRGRNRSEQRLGSNGSGKSSLWDAVCWCLYGVTPGGLRNPDVQPWSGVTKATRVSLILEVNDKRCVITRTASPNTLKLDGQDVGPGAIEKRIGMTFEIMTNTIILGQGRPLFFDLPPAKKMEMLSEVKGLDRWDSRSEQSRARAETLETELATVEGEITGLEAGSQQIEEGIAAVAKEEEAWRKENAQHRAKVQTFLKAADKRLEGIEREVATADLKYDGAMTEVKACERQLNQLHGDVTSAKANLSHQQATRERTVARIEKLTDYLDELKESKRCPTCGHVVRPGDLREHKIEVTTELDKLTDSLPKLKPKLRNLATAEDNLQHAQSYLNSFHAKADSAMQTLKRKQEDAAQLREAIRTAREAAADNPHTQLLRQANKRLRVMKSDIEAANKDKRIIERELVRSKFWVKGFRDIKLHVIEELLQELEITTAGMLEEVGLIGWEIKYLIERETKKGKIRPGLTILIRSPKSKGLVKWESWSGGEGQRLRIVGALSLASVLLSHAGVEPSMEVLDEPTQHLSDEGVYDLCDFLADRAQRTSRVILYADHQSVDSTRFAGTITVRRDKNGSSIRRVV